MARRHSDPAVQRALVREFAGRAAAAVFGGYGASYAIMAGLSAWSPWHRATTVYLVGSLIFLAWLGFIIWAFAARDVRAAWIPPVAATVVFGAAALIGMALK